MSHPARSSFRPPRAALVFASLVLAAGCQSAPELAPASTATA
ncbi:MAG: hypothetical protein R2712_21205 [Vicinamibacterales bacterium]